MSTTQHPTNAPASLADIEKMHELVAGYTVSACIYVAARLGLADHLAAGPRRADDLAREVQTAEEPLYRLLRALASVGVVHEAEGRTFQLTPMGATLRSDIPNSLRGIVEMVGSEWHWRSWGDLLHAVKTGEPSFVKTFGTGFFSYIRDKEDVARGFDRGMTSLSSVTDQAIAAAYDFGAHRVVVDVGGGQGGLLVQILEAAPGVRGILYDRPDVVANALPSLRQGNLAARATVTGGNFFESVPVGGDLYVIKHVLHGLDHAQSVAVLARIGDAMSPGGRLLVVEMVVAGPNVPSYAKFNDLGMMLLSGTGRERTEAELIAIFHEAGFATPKIQHVQIGVSTLAADKR